MRIAAVTDIHGNWTALQAVIRDLKTVGADLVVFGGDLVGSGARPAEVLDLASDLGWLAIIGNTDEMLWMPGRVTELVRDPALQEIVFNDIAWTREAIGEKRLQWLHDLPEQWRGHGVAIVHASPGDLWKAPGPTTADRELERVYSSLATPLAVYGHIHQPYVRQLSEFVVANSGSVSLSYDGDPRASYLLADDGRPMIRRVAYDVEAEIRDLAAKRYPYRGWLATMLRAGKYVRPLENQ